MRDRGFGQLSFESSAKKVSIEQHGRRCRSTSICLVFCSPPLEKMLVPRVRLRLLEKTDSYTYVGAAPADVESHNKALGQDYGLGFATDGTTRFFSTKVKSADRARAFRIDDEIELRYDTSKGVVQLWAKNGKGAFVMINEHGPIPRGYRFAIGCVYCRNVSIAASRTPPPLPSSSSFTPPLPSSSSYTIFDPRLPHLFLDMPSPLLRRCTFELLS